MPDTLTPRLLVFLVGLAQHVTSLNRLSIVGGLWEEKHAGVLGLLLLKNPQLRSIEFTGSLHCKVLNEIVKYCKHLERLWKTDTEKRDLEPGETDRGQFPMDSSLLASILSGCPHLTELRIGGVRFTESQPPMGHELLPCPLTSSAIQVLHIENIGCNGGNGPGDSNANSSSRFGKCSFPKLRALCVSEQYASLESGSCLPFSDILNIIDQSHELERVEISAQFAFTKADCQRIVRCIPKLQCLQLKPYTSSFVHHTEPRLTDAALDILLKGLSLESLSIESIGWEEHWDSYSDLQEPFLLLQYPFPSLSVFTQNIDRFQYLQTCILFGEVTNLFVHSLLSTCKSLSRLELYILGRKTAVDDTLFAPIPTTDPYTSLKTLHLHLWKVSSQSSSRSVLTAGCLKDLRYKFPSLEKLAVLGLKNTDSQVCQAIATEATHVQHLVVGPLLNTTSELLNIVGCLHTLQQLDLCWDGGSLPTGDEVFDSALGTKTLFTIIKRINPNVRVQDTTGHFYPLSALT
uniref:Uncharacterized protein n=1 Tax=Eutreptiella gymnastica TaxID=73025 RepID=A0A7S1NER5_9EUGL